MLAERQCLQDGSYNFLKFSGENKITIVKQGSTGNFYYFQLWYKDKTDNIWKDANLTNLPQIVVNDAHPLTGLSQSVNIHKVSASSTEVSLPIGNDEFIFNFWVDTKDADGNVTGQIKSISNVKANFYYLEDIIDVTPSTTSCFKFSNFSLNNLTDEFLSGFCGHFDFKLRMPPNSQGALGIPANWVSGSQFFEEGDIVSIPADCSGVSTDPDCIAPANHPSPVPCKCINMELEVRIAKCPSAPAYCPTHLSIYHTIQVCCACDVRQSGGNE